LVDGTGRKKIGAAGCKSEFLQSLTKGGLTTPAGLPDNVLIVLLLLRVGLKYPFCEGLQTFWFTAGCTKF
jgi:hypothetical protein